ncbi:MAG: hypothetical protein IKV63_00080 [Clostridia bacterium]|nr:hypothetical protein [Clostridia bacterium]
MKKLIIFILCATLVWSALIITDFLLVRTYHKPLFCIGANLADDGGSGKYIGLGYSFYLEGGFMPDDDEPDVTSYKGYIFGNKVMRGYWERMLVMEE